MGFELNGKTALVIGANGSIATASARRLLKDGAAVVLMSRGREKLERTRTEFLATFPDARVELAVGDGLDAEDVGAAARSAQSISGQLDIVVSSVGEGGFIPIMMHDVKSFRDNVDKNLLPAFVAIRYCTPLMPEGGSIVCVSSTAAKLVLPWVGVYCAAKAGMEMLVRCAAEELSPARIRINVVRPGMTVSDASLPVMEDPAMGARFMGEIPLGRWGEPTDIAEAIRYLVGPESAYVTGQVFAVDGGLELRRNINMTEVLKQMYGEAAAEAVMRGRPPA